VLGGADDAGDLRVVLDGVDRSDEIERFASLGMLTLLEELATGMRETTGAQPFSGLGDRVVAGELIDDEPARRVAEHLLSGLSAAAWSVAIDDDLRSDEVPEIRASLQVLLSNARLIRVDISGGGDEREGGVVQGPQFVRRAMEQIAHGAACDRNSDLTIRLFKSILWNRIVALGDDEMSDEARCVPRLFANAIGSGRRNHMAATAGERFASEDALAEVGAHVLDDARDLSLTDGPQRALTRWASSGVIRHAKVCHLDVQVRVAELGLGGALGRRGLRRRLGRRRGWRQLRALALLALVAGGAALELFEARHHRGELGVLRFGVRLPPAVVIVVVGRDQREVLITSRGDCRSSSARHRADDRNRCDLCCALCDALAAARLPGGGAAGRGQIEASEQHRQLGPVEHDAVGPRFDIGHAESALGQTLIVDDEAASVPEEDLHAIDPPADEYEEVPLERIHAESRSHKRGQAIMSASQIDGLGRQVDTRPRRNAQHPTRSAAIKRVRYSTSVSEWTRMIRSLIWISIGLEGAAAVRDGRTTTGNNSGRLGATFFSRQRHHERVRGWTPYRRATSATVEPRSTSALSCCQNSRPYRTPEASGIAEPSSRRQNPYGYVSIAPRAVDPRLAVSPDCWPR